MRVGPDDYTEDEPERCWGDTTDCPQDWHHRWMTETELASGSGVTAERIHELVELGILSSDSEFGPADVRRVRLVEACAEAGLSLEAIGAAMRSGRLSLSFLDQPVYRGWAAHTGSTFAELAGETGLSVELLVAVREALGFALPDPDDPVREDDLRVVPAVRTGLDSGLDPEAMVRVLRVYGEALSRIVEAETIVYSRYMEKPLRDAGEPSSEVMRLASEIGGRIVPLLEDALLAMYRRHQERVWVQNLIENIEDTLEAEGLAAKVDRPPAMCFLDLTGYTTITEEEGDEMAAHLAARVGDLVHERAVRYGGRAVKWLGDGVMLFFSQPARGVLAALETVAELESAGLPAAHVGIDAGPVVQQDGDYFGRTVNLAARVSARAGPGEVLVTSAVVESAADEEGIRFDEAGMFRPKGMSRLLPLYRASGVG